MDVLSDAQREAGWTIAKLGDICAFVAGSAFPQKEQGKVSGDYPFAKVKDLQSVAGLSWRNIDNWIEESQLKTLKSKIIPVKSIVFAKIGEGLKRERFALSSIPMCIDNNLMAAIPSTAVNNIWLYYKFKTLNISSLVAGSALPYLRVQDLKDLDISLPPLEEQERIAGILGSLDDKIEANTRLIQTLLDTADSIFQKFYSECELSESTYASLEVYGGGTPSTKNETYWGGDIHWLTPTDVTSLGSPMLFDTARKLTEDGLNACSSKLHPAGSIMMTSRATIGAFAINQYPAATNQGFIVAVPQREEERWWIYHHMKKDVPEMINSANGTTFLEISRRTFKGLPYGSLSDENLDRFHAVVNPLYELVKISEQENLQLAETRDALIKRLIG